MRVQARSTTLGVLHPRLDLMKIVHEHLNDMLPHNAHEICTRRLYVSLTRFADGRNVVISDFASKEELIQVSTLTVALYFGRHKSAARVKMRLIIWACLGTLIIGV
jgi:hypothetical protein